MNNQTFTSAADAVDYAESTAIMLEHTMIISAHDDGYVVQKAGRRDPAFVIERIRPTGDSFAVLDDRYYRLKS